MMVLTLPIPAWICERGERLMARYRSSRVPQGLMLYGPEGYGKSILAKQLAKDILCLDQHSNSACEKCQSCLWFAHGHHPDFKLLEGNDEILIKSIRELILFSQTTAETHSKVITIVDADRMNINAANSLLKLLEEPPNNLYFILTTSHRERLPVTILSRVQKEYVVERDILTISNWLREAAPELSQSDAEQLLAYVYYSPYSALSLHQEDFLLKLPEQTEIICQSLIGNDLTKNVEKLLKNREIAYICLFYWLIAHQKEQTKWIPNEINRILVEKSDQKKLKQYYSLLSIYSEESLTTREDWALEQWFISF